MQTQLGLQRLGGARFSDWLKYRQNIGKDQKYGSKPQTTRFDSTELATQLFGFRPCRLDLGLVIRDGYQNDEPRRVVRSVITVPRLRGRLVMATLNNLFNGVAHPSPFHPANFVGDYSFEAQARYGRRRYLYLSAKISELAQISGEYHIFVRELD